MSAWLPWQGRLYWRLLLELMNGPHSRELRDYVGHHSLELYYALFDRIDPFFVDKSGGLEARWQPDLVDICAARPLSRAARANYDANEFRTMTRFTFKELEAFIDKLATSARPSLSAGDGESSPADLRRPTL